MKTLYRFALAIPFAAAMLFAQDPQSDSQTRKTDKSRTTGQADVGGPKPIREQSLTQTAATPVA